MGYETNLIFNRIELPRKRLLPMRDTARKILLENDCPWSYMLNYIYAESSDGDIIDLQISKKSKKELTSLHGTSPVPLDKLSTLERRDNGEDEPDDPWFLLEWNPYDVGETGKWYHVDGFVAWLCAFCTGGQLFQLTWEDDGGIWGWEFQEGRFRELVMIPKGRWRKPRPPITA